MKTLPLVDPALRPLLDMFPAIDISSAGLAEARAIVLSREPEDFGVSDGLPVIVEERMIAGPQGPGSLRVLILRPDNEPAALRGGILHVHGGGYVLARPEGTLPLLRATVAAHDCVIVTVDYRLAPESTWREATADGFAGLVWMAENADALGVDPHRIGVMGESAGGGLAAAIAFIARDQGGPKLAFQNLLYPMLDDRTVTRQEDNPVTGEFVWTRPHNRNGWTAYLGHAPGVPDVSPYAAPARAADLTGLPPTWIGTGALDLFLEEDAEYALRLIRAGVAVDFAIWPGAYHGFDQSPDAPVALRATEERQAAIGRALAP
jgi:acetyl esterase/lipase